MKNLTKSKHPQSTHSKYSIAVQLERCFYIKKLYSFFNIKSFSDDSGKVYLHQYSQDSELVSGRGLRYGGTSMVEANRLTPTTYM